MPKPKKIKDMWWSEMSDKAHQAAEIMGYTNETWDADAKIPYDSKPFIETTLEERRAAMYLSLDPIVSKLDPLWWRDTDPITQKYSQTLGWDEKKWDGNWSIRDLPIEHKYWKELSSEEKEAAMYVGYVRCTWDEDWEDSDLDLSEPVSLSSMPSKAAAPSAPTKVQKEDDHNDFKAQAAQVKADVAVEEEIQGAMGSSNSSSKASSSLPNQKSKKFGGDGGEGFNHGNHNAIAKITIRTDGHAVHQIAVVYAGGKLLKSGSDDGDVSKSFSFSLGEYVTGVKVRHNKFIQSITFITNKGEMMGPVGGKGWKLALLGKGILGKDKEGDEEEVTAPSGYKLGGFSGSAGSYVDSLVIHWVPL